MEAIRARLKAIACTLSALALFQSCVSYHRLPTTLEEASKEHIKTKVVNTEGETVKYKYITYKDGQFYGMNRKSGEWIKTPINNDEITNVFTKAKTESTILTIIVIAVPIIALVAFAQSMEGWFDFNLPEEDSKL